MDNYDNSDKVEETPTQTLNTSIEYPLDIHGIAKFFHKSKAAIYTAYSRGQLSCLYKCDGRLYGFPTELAKHIRSKK